MLLGIELFLTVAAWKRGWKGWALLPLAAVLIVGFGLGLMSGQNGSLTQLAPVLDVVAIIVLGIMVAARKPAPTTVSPSSMQNNGPVSFGAPVNSAPVNIYGQQVQNTANPVQQGAGQPVPQANPFSQYQSSPFVQGQPNPFQQGPAVPQANVRPEVTASPFAHPNQ